MALNNFLRNITVLFFAGFLFTACTRIGSTELGLGLLPAGDSFNTKDTLLDVETMTVDRPDTLRVYGSDDHVVGTTTNDPIFGTTTASMYFQLKPTYFPYSTRGSRDSVVVDSAVLILSYRGFYGDSTRPVTLNLKRISAATPLTADSIIASNYPEKYNFQTDATMANPYTLDFARIHDSVNNRFENAVHQIRIPLTRAFADMFLKTFDTNTAYKTDTTLRQYFPGFALTTDAASNNNVLVRINLLDTNTKLGLYYSTNSVTSTVAGMRDTVVDYFRFALYDNGDANFIKRNRTATEAARHLGVNNDSLVYVQTSPGTMVKIKIPGLKTFANKIIHRAELIAEQVPTDNPNALESQWTAPSYLFLGAYDSAANVIRNVPNDYQGTVNSGQFVRFGGKVLYKSIQGYDNVATYNFEISRYMQGVISRKDSIFDLRMIAPVNDSIKYVPAYPNNYTAGADYLTNTVANAPGFGRVRLGGGRHSKFRMRLHVYYSNL
jgi:hypothetical protein